MPKSIYTHLLLVLIVLGTAAVRPEPAVQEAEVRQGLGGRRQPGVLGPDAPNENPKEVIEKTIEVLKRRVDPDGLMEVSMVQAGNDRIEISMPLPGENVKKLKKVYDDLGRAWPATRSPTPASIR